MILDDPKPDVLAVHVTVGANPPIKYSPPLKGEYTKALIAVDPNPDVLNAQLIVSEDDLKVGPGPAAT